MKWSSLANRLGTKLASCFLVPDGLTRSNVMNERAELSKLPEMTENPAV
jgi:hypothetical protein